VADRHVEGSRALAERFRAAGLRAHVDESHESVGKRIRAAELQRAPYTLVVGDKELESGELTVRDRSGDETPAVDVAEFIDALASEASSRALEQARFGR
jgi:threonyl-tRNA synthetase